MISSNEKNIDINLHHMQLSKESLEEAAYDIISTILQEKFQNRLKQQISKKSGRFNFACPYCGDSVDDMHKKRGNLYLDDFMFHCFNCSKHCSFLALTKDNNKYGIVELEYRSSFLNIEKTASNKSKTNTIVNYDTLMFNYDNDIILKFLKIKEEIEEKLNLVSADKSDEAKYYLSSRLQYDFNRFSYDTIGKKIYIYNTYDKYVLGYQYRNLNKVAAEKRKYVSFKTSKVLGLNEILDDFTTKEIYILNKLDDISLFFNLFNVDITQKMYVLEGPFDSFLLRNAISTSGGTKDLPFYSSNFYFIYDNDIDGQKQTIKRLKQSFYVFLWSKYIKDNNIPYRSKWDITDLLLYKKNNNVKLSKIENYFSNNMLDMLNI